MPWKIEGVIKFKVQGLSGRFGLRQGSPRSFSVVSFASRSRFVNGKARKSQSNLYSQGACSRAEIYRTPLGVTFWRIVATFGLSVFSVFLFSVFPGLRSTEKSTPRNTQREEEEAANTGSVRRGMISWR